MRSFLGLLLMFLLSSYICSLAAVPASRTHVLMKDDPSAHNSVAQGAMDMKVEEGGIKGRIDMEEMDYAGPGANPSHDPKVRQMLRMSVF
ncbi:hypothetical protein F0562_015771 [Nyssa sinensis]|uniref:Uncharacterized protein n=1 Tax=Nyssa sinensis TaxID=561372 RepID=A0A5J4ZL39_9ASTE|nr:hypothetical protein F0562_015771 [Nyssa sinensis]